MTIHVPSRPAAPESSSTSRTPRCTNSSWKGSSTELNLIDTHSHYKRRGWRTRRSDGMLRARGEGRAPSAGRAEPTLAPPRTMALDPSFPPGTCGRRARWRGGRMTTPLPAAPSLEQLRKQAKELVRERRDGGEPLRLSDAQLVARARIRLPELAAAEGLRRARDRRRPRARARVRGRGRLLRGPRRGPAQRRRERARERDRDRPGLPPGARGRERCRDPRDEHGRCPPRAGARARLPELGCVPPARREPVRERRAVPAGVQGHPGARPNGARDAARPLSRPGRRTRDERQRPARPRDE